MPDRAELIVISETVPVEVGLEEKLFGPARSLESDRGLCPEDQTDDLC